MKILSILALAALAVLPWHSLCNHSSPVWGRRCPAHLNTVTRQVQLLLLCHLLSISAQVNPPQGSPFSWVEKKKLLLFFLIDYLESPWNGGNCLKTVCPVRASSLCRDQANVSASRTHPVGRALQALCFMSLGNKCIGCCSLGVEPESRGSPARVCRGRKSVGTAATELIRIYSSWSGFRNVWPGPSLCLAPSLLGSEHSG